MKKYEIKYATKEIRKKENLFQGCTINCDGTDYTESTGLIFEDLVKAEEKLKEFHTEIKYCQGNCFPFYYVKEYFIEDVSSEETSDRISFTPMNLIKKMYVACAESGDKIREVFSVGEGLASIESFEKLDTEEGIYEKDFYNIVDENCLDIN